MDVMLPRTVRRPPVRTRTVLVPLGAALVLSAGAAFVEVRTVALAYGSCGVGVGAAANGLYLLFLAMPVLTAVQTALVGVPAPLLARLSRRRSVVVPLLGVHAAAVVVLVAWAFFAWSGLPVVGEPGCASPEPGWWPGWLPPGPAPFYPPR